MKQHTDTLRIPHLILLAAGGLFLLSGALHDGMWFDESYSVALLRQPFCAIPGIAAGDVHPVLYYLLLRLFCLPFGGNVLAARLFSVLGGFLFALLGYTHIRRDFGEKTGFWFSLLAFLFPVLFRYAGEIRMYTWLPLFVTLAALYARRFFAGSGRGRRDAALFALFSLAAAYTHYYGLAAVCMLNALLLTALIVRRQPLRGWLCSAAAQLLLYVPGLLIFLRQLGVVSKGYWIEVRYPDVLWELFAFPLVGDPKSDALALSEPVYALLTGLGIFLFAIAAGVLFRQLRCRETRQAARPALFALLACVGVVGGVLLISFWKPFFYARYLMALYGLYLFFLAFAFSHLRLRPLRVLLPLLLCVVLVLRVVPLYMTAYDGGNAAAEATLTEQIQAGDTIVYRDVAVGGPLAVRYPDTEQVFYNSDFWDVGTAYSAYAPTMRIAWGAQELAELSGRVWVVAAAEEDRDALCALLRGILAGRVTQEQEMPSVYQPYHNITYRMTLLTVA